MPNSRNGLCCLAKYLPIGAGAILALGLVQASTAQTCLQDEYNTVNKQKLNCSANDVRVAQVSNVTDLSGNPLSTCIEGSTFDFIANFNIVTTANAANSGGRDNIGLYFQTDPSQGQALTGTCVDNIIYKPHPCTSGTGLPSDNATCGVLGANDYQEFDSTPDNCGDTASSVNPNITDRMIVRNFVCSASNTVPCPFDNTKQCLSLPNCTSWQVPGSSSLCVASPPTYAYPFNGKQAEAVPGSPSKCNCAVIPLPIQPVNPKPIALKACTTPLTPDSGATAVSFTFDSNNPPGTASPINCDAGVEGSGTATYTVALDNPNVSGAFGDIIVDQICDSAYGQVYPATGTCKAGSTGQTITATTCSALDVPLGTFQTCTFTAPSLGELNTVQDVVTFSGHSKVNNTVLFSGVQTNQVTVHSSDAPATATVTKSFTANEAACATVRYNVEIDNTSGFDEDETLSALQDDGFGDITKVQGHVLATTCSAPQTIKAGGKYSCNFDAQICSNPNNDSGLDANGCFTHSNTINVVTLVADEPTDAPFNATSNQLTVKECIQMTP